MKLQETFVASCIAAVALSIAAAPYVDQDDVVLSQNRGSRLVSVKYTLRGDPGVVTVDFQTNAAENAWLSIGAENFKNVQGEVNKLVRDLDVQHEITWQPRDSWPDHVIRGGKFRAVVTAWATNSPPDYMVIDLLKSKGDVSYYVSTNAMPYLITDGYCKTNSLVMRRIHAAHVQWMMGSPTSETGRQACEERHYVTLSADYYIGVFEFTKGQYYRMKGTFSGAGYPASAGVNRMEFGSADRPVEYIVIGTFRGNGWPDSGHGTVGSSSTLKSARDYTGYELDLPTEAQWEYACRAGTTTAIYTGATFSKNSNAPGRTSMGAVGTVTPNAWGLYDMYGNADETCLDRVTGNSLGSAPVCNPIGISGSGSYDKVVCRGGNYYDGANAKTFRSAYRYFATGRSKVRGFRLVCPATAIR